MAQAKLSALDITISGLLSPSLLASINRAESMLRAFGVSNKTQAAGMARVYNAAFGSISSNMAKTQTQAERLHDSMERIFEVASGVSLGEFLARGMEKAIGLIEEAGEKLKEFAVSSLEVKAERESLQLQQHATLSSMGMSGMGPGLDKMVRSMQGRETMMGYEALTRTSNLLLNASPERFGSVDAIHKMLGQLSDVSRDPTTFGMATQALTRIMAEGKVDARHIQEMGIDTGYNFRDAMAKALKVTPEEMTEMMKKHQITGQDSITALLKAFDIITGPGGAAYKHAEAQLSGLNGLLSRFLADWGNFEESFGTELENFIRPVADKILGFLQNVDLQNAFSGMEGFMKTMGVLVSTLDFTNEINKLKLMGIELGGFFKALTGGFDPQTMLKQKFLLHGGSKNIGSVWETTAAYDKWHEAMFGWINSLLDKLKQLGERMGSIGERLAPIMKLLDLLNKWDDILYGRIYPALEKIFQFIDDHIFGWLKMIIGHPAVMATPGGAVYNAQDKLNSLINAGASDEDIAKAKQALLDAETAQKNQTEAVNSSADAFNALNDAMGGRHYGGNYGLHGALSDNPGETYYEHPDTEGHSSQYGPMGNKLGYNYGVGLGKAYGNHFGEWATIRLPNGKVITRQVNESSRRDHGIEFVTPHDDESSYGSGKSEILGYSKDKPSGGASITINNHIYAMDSHGVDRVMREHGETIADHIRRVWDGQNERSAVV